jgi:polyisoprenoid-binding protein YceI
VVAVAEPNVASQTVWQLDPSHTLVEFSVKHLVFTTVKGRFTGVSGQIVIAGDDPTRGSVSVTIDASSIDTRDEKRDEHLRSGDFIETAEYPNIVFTSKRIEPVGGNRFRVVGDLSIRGVTREVVLDATYNGQAKAPWGTEVISYSATAEINRKDYGVNWNVALETGGWAVGDTVKITIEAEAIKQA